MVRELSTEVVWCNGMVHWGITAHQGRSSGTDLRWISIIIFLPELELEIKEFQIKKLIHIVKLQCLIPRELVRNSASFRRLPLLNFEPIFSFSVAMIQSLVLNSKQLKDYVTDFLN